MADTSTAQPPRGALRNLTKRTGKWLFRGVLLRALAAQSRIPNDPVLDEALFPWAVLLRERWPRIQAEVDALLRDREVLPNFQDISPDQYRISPNERWKTFMLYGFGERFDFGCWLCPETDAVLRQIPGLKTAFFSIIGPGKHVPLHRGVTNGLVRCHLGLRIPQGPGACEMEVGGQRCVWREGELIFFDDTFPHQVWNETQGERAVLLLDFDRPMGWWGRVLHRGMLAALRRSAYFRDAVRNQRAWEQRYRAYREAQDGSLTSA